MSMDREQDSLAISILSRRSLHAIFGLTDTPMSGLSDDRLLELGKQWQELHDERMAHLEILTQAEQRFYETRPEFPDALVKTEADVELRLCDRQHIGERYDPAVFNTWSGRPSKRRVKYDVTPELRETYNLPEDATTLELMEPWTERQARVDEILTAWDEYQAALERAEAETGYKAADEHDTALYKRLDTLEDEIARTPAISMAGLLLKVRVGVAYASVRPDGKTPDLDRNLEDAIKHSDRTDICGISILRDLYNIGVLGIS